MSIRRPNEREAYRRRAEVWGFVYETLVKRGMLTFLFEQRHLSWDSPAARRLTEWRTGAIDALFARTCTALEYRDAHGRRMAAAHFQHLAFQSFGYGYTLMRALARPWRPGGQIQALWCPLAWPHDGNTSTRDTQFTHWLETFELPLPDRSWRKPGRAANADMVLWRREGRQDELIVVEYSRDAPADECSWLEPDDHQKELADLVYKQRRRGQFAQISSEIVSEAPLQLSAHAPKFFDALLHQDRPLFKLCQAAAYGTDLVTILQRFERCMARGRVRAVAVTTSGVESLTARWGSDTCQDARWALLESLGDAYRQYKARKQPNTTWDRAGAIDSAIDRFAGLLPRQTLREQFKTQFRDVTPGDSLTLQLEETIEHYHRPYDAIASETVLGNLAPEVPLDYRQRLSERLEALAARGQPLTLRNAHAAAVQAAILNAKPGLNVLALEANPGIGKTTSMLQLLEALPGGFLFFYFSPRLVINQDVTQQFAAQGVVTLRTDAALIQHARDWYRYLAAQGRYPAGLAINTAVIVGGAANMAEPPASNILFVPEAWLEELESRVKPRHNRDHRIQRLNEHTDRATDVQRPGVFRTLARAAHLWLQRHPECQRLALTASIQAHRLAASAAQGTVEKLLHELDPDIGHRHPGRARAGLQRLARRLPRWIFMIDEITGDGAGAALVRALRFVLRDTLLEPFEAVNAPCPLTLSLVVADASLVNEQVMARYLATQEAPERVYVAPSAGREAFGVAVHALLGDTQALHVKTNSFPAATLRLEYRLALYPREHARPKADDQDRRRVIAMQTIQSALDRGARQVLYFAQDRRFLSELYESSRTHGWRTEIITSQVKPSRRRAILSDQARAQTQVFLMTSSASRGVSFPCAEVIIAEVPTFDIEAHFMELAQLIYRGRGALKLEGEHIDGDRRDRRLVFLLTNTYLEEEGTEATDPERARAHWLGLVWNLLSALILLRATLLTRLQGDAGLTRPLAIIPVGRSAMSDTLRSLFDTAQAALDALAKLQTDPHLPRETRALAAGLLKDISRHVSATYLDLQPAEKPGQWPPMDPQGTLALRRAIAGLGAPWIPPGVSGDLPFLSLDDECLGPFIKLRRPMSGSQENFLFDHLQGARDQIKRGLGALLHAAREQGASLQQLQALDSLEHLIQRDDHEAQVTTLFKEPIHEQASYWSAMPSDWWAVSQGPVDSDGGTRLRLPSDQDAMKTLLSQALGLFKPAAIPVVANYTTYPYATQIGLNDPSPLARSLDEDAVACSRELNLINTLLT